MEKKKIAAEAMGPTAIVPMLLEVVEGLMDDAITGDDGVLPFELPEEAGIVFEVPLHDPTEEDAGRDDAFETAIGIAELVRAMVNFEINPMMVDLLNAANAQNDSEISYGAEQLASAIAEVKNAFCDQLYYGLDRLYQRLPMIEPESADIVPIGDGDSPE